METQKKGLGRGLAALIPVRSKPVSTEAEVPIPEAPQPFRRIPVSSIVPNPLQPRKFFDDQKIAGLASSIREKGILQPLIVTQKAGRYEIVSGERRFRAAQAAGLTEIPVIVREAESSEGLEIAIIENVQREDLDPIEEASAYQELMDRFAYTQEQVSQKMGKDRATVANTLRLLKLPTKAKQALQSGRISVGHARALLSVPEIERQLYFVDRVAEEGWSVRELEMRVASKRVLRAGKKPREVKALPTKFVSLLDGLRRRLGTQVRIVPQGDKGKIIIEYYSENDLDRVYQVLANTDRAFNAR